jgi:L-fuculose-phosphate aldolase
LKDSDRSKYIRELIRSADILDRAGCCPASDGNFSVRSESSVLLTRAGIEKRALTEESFVEIGLSASDPNGGSSEWDLHRAIYAARPDIKCILHVHAPYLTTYAAAHIIPPVTLLAEAQMAVGEIALVPYRNPGTRALGEQTVAASATAKVFLLANHGVVVLGASVRDALHRLERAEFLARVAWQCLSLGGGLPLAAAQLAAQPEGDVAC